MGMATKNQAGFNDGVGNENYDVYDAIDAVDLDGLTVDRMEPIKNQLVLIPQRKKFTWNAKSWILNLKQQYGNMKMPEIRVRHFIEAKKWKVCEFLRKKL